MTVQTEVSTEREFNKPEVEVLVVTRVKGNTGSKISLTREEAGELLPLLTAFVGRVTSEKVTR